MGPSAVSVMKGQPKSFVVVYSPLAVGGGEGNLLGGGRGEKTGSGKPPSAGCVFHAHRPARLNPREARAGTA